MDHLKLFTDVQLLRLWNRLYRRVTVGSGYQPFGWDWATLWVVNPSLARAMVAVRNEINRRIKDNGSLAA